MNKSSGLAFRPYVESIAKLISGYFNQNFEIQSSSFMVFLHGKILIFGASKIIYIILIIQHHVTCKESFPSKQNHNSL